MLAHRLAGKLEGKLEGELKGELKGLFTALAFMAASNPIGEEEKKYFLDLNNFQTDRDEYAEKFQILISRYGSESAQFPPVKTRLTLFSPFYDQPIALLKISKNQLSDGQKSGSGYWTITT